MDSLLTLPDNIHLPGTPEHFTALLTSDSGLLVERIARLGFDDGREVSLERGQCLLLPKHVRHRVLETSKPCVWLAIHAPQLRPQEADDTPAWPKG